MGSPEKEPRSTPAAGIIVAVGALALLVMFMLSQPRSGGDVPPDQAPIAMAVVNELMTNGVLVDYDCMNAAAWVNRAVWAKYNADQHRNMIISLATVCQRQRGTYRISIQDYDSKREIASFDGTNLKINR